MVKVLVGHTGFVGSNLAAQGAFDLCFNSKNVAESYGTKPDLLVYAGVRSEMFTANSDPQADAAHVEEAARNIEKIAPAQVVLVSTVAVYGKPRLWDEGAGEEAYRGAAAYGANRFRLERRVRETCANHLAVRLPAIYGAKLKKNFVCDMIRFAPPLLKEGKYAELSRQSAIIKAAYKPRADGFCALSADVAGDKAAFAELKAEFKRLGFSALNFTDSRSRYQFYNLAFLWGHIQLALENGITTLNLVTEPVTAAEVVRYVDGGEFKNETSASPYDYDLRTRHAALFGGENGYVFGKQFVLDDLKAFIQSERRKLEP